MLALIQGLGFKGLGLVSRDVGFGFGIKKHMWQKVLVGLSSVPKARNSPKASYSMVFGPKSLNR